MFNEDEIKDQVDEFNQVMDDMFELRRASARELAEAAAWLVKITEGYAEAYREAVKSGWTPAQLRKAKFPEPGHRKRRKREQKKMVNESTAEVVQASETDDGDGID